MCEIMRASRCLVALQYTLILLASKALPKQCVDYISGKSKTRRTVGVRLVADPVCQAISCDCSRSYGFTYSSNASAAFYGNHHRA